MYDEYTCSSFGDSDITDAPNYPVYGKVYREISDKLDEMAQQLNPANEQDIIDAVKAEFGDKFVRATPCQFTSGIIIVMKVPNPYYANELMDDHFIVDL